MAIFHLAAQVIGRSTGRSAVAAAAYRAGDRLRDERLGHDHDFTAKAGVIHSAVLLPPGAPDGLADRERLWNAVEAAERRKDAQLAREIEFALPSELSDEDNVALAREYAQEQFVERGMIADLNVHKARGPDGEARPHAHVMLTMRAVGPDGFGGKRREWNMASLVVDWREALAVKTNQRLAERGIAARVDHRSYAQRGIGLEPQTKIGPAAHDRHRHRRAALRAAEHRELARRNGERIAADPVIALDALTEHRSTFTRRDLARFAATHSDGAEQFRLVVARIEASPETVRLGTDRGGEERFTSRAMLAVERRMETDAAALAAGKAHRADPREPGAAIAGLRSILSRAMPSMAERAMPGTPLSPEQREALRHVTRPDGLSLVVGYAGTGKSTMLGAAREAWERAGYRVRGAALSGVAADALRVGAGVESRTLASLEHAWSRDRDGLTARDVLVVDEAGMVGSRQMGRVLARARQAGAKVVLVGDPEQLQAIGAGGAFRTLAARHGAAELREVRRQRDGWQREATRELATGRIGEALARYEAAGMVRAAGTREEARAHLVGLWDHDRRATPERSQIILAYTREDVRELNEFARERLRAGGRLGEERTLRTERGELTFAAGDRVMFLRNERSMGVRNGTIGTLETIEGRRLAVRVDGPDGRTVAFDLRDYAHLTHGYAATVHKAQGITVDRSYVLASRHMDRHAAYVALTRHRLGVELVYAREEFGTAGRLVDALGRDRAKDTSLDYGATLGRGGTMATSTKRADRAPSWQRYAGAPTPQDLAEVRQAAKERAMARHAAEARTAGPEVGRGRGQEHLPGDADRSVEGQVPRPTTEQVRTGVGRVDSRELARVRQAAKERAEARHAAEARAREPETERVREEAHRRHDAERAREREWQTREGERAREKGRDRADGAGLSL